MGKNNPYQDLKSNSTLATDVLVSKVASRCLAKNDGIMFKLFDIGNLSFKESQLYVFKNKVGDVIRYFIKQLEIGIVYHEAFENLKSSLHKIAKLSCSDNDKYLIFINDMDAIILELNEVANDKEN